MAVTGWRNPSSYLQVTTSGGNWSSPANAYTSNNSRATINPGGSSSDMYRFRGFGFDTVLLDTDVIDGIEIQAEGYAAGSGNRQWWSVYDATNGSSATSVNKAFSTGGDSIKTMGGATDLWGETTILASDVRSSTFGLQTYAAQYLYIGYYAVYIDALWMRIYYTPGVTSDVDNRSGIVLASIDEIDAITKANANEIDGIAN